MSWNIKTPGDYINGPLTVAGAVTLNSGLTVAGGARFNSTVAVGMTPEKSLNVKTSYVFGLASNGGFKVENYTDTRGLYFEHILGGTILENAYYYGANQFYPTATSSSSVSFDAGSIALFSNSGLTVGTPFLRTQRAIFDASGNLGVGVTPPVNSNAPGIFLNGSSNVFGSVTNGVTVSSNVYNGSSAWKYINNGVASLYQQLSGKHYWYTAASGNANNNISWLQAMTLNANGILALYGGNDAANGVGISFPSAQSASTDANTLDDYEEGTFTPTVFGRTTPGVGTYTIQVGRYTKIGTRVIVDVYVNWSAHTGTGFISLGNLPFQIKGTSNMYPTASFGYVENLALPASAILTGIGIPGTNTIELIAYPAGGGSNTNVSMDGNAAIVYTISYEV